MHLSPDASSTPVISSSGRTRAKLAVALTAILGLTLSGCAAAKDLVNVDDHTSSPSASASGAPSGDLEFPQDLDSALEPFYSQDVAWTDCDGFECASITAPLNWSDASEGETVVALKRSTAREGSTGSILINPGGPGGSGTEFLQHAVSMISPEILDGFDIVAFDPRGVGESGAVVCLDDKEKDAALSKDHPATPEGLAELEKDATVFGEACLENTGELLGHVDTASAAHDMDLIRALVGDEKLNYLGYSYGTQLGAAYAGQFPDRVGRLVLDGAVDITVDPDAANLEQARGFERALRNYVEDCQTGSCPLTGSVDDGLEQIKALVDRAADNPLTTGSGRRLTQTLAFYGIAVTLYDNATWGLLTQGLDEAISENDGSTLLMLADVYNDRNADGSFSSNSMEANWAIGCADSRADPDPEHMAEQAAKILEVAPTLGESFSYGALGCKNWPVPEVETSYDVSAPGAAPILVIGTTNDPATPFEWSEALSKTLESAVLLTWEGEGHTAYGRSNECVADVVDEFFQTGQVPDDGVVC